MIFSRQADALRAWFAVRTGTGAPRTGIAASIVLKCVAPDDGATSTPVVAESTQQGGLYYADIPSSFFIAEGLGDYVITVEITSVPLDFNGDQLRITERLWDDLSVAGDAMALTPVERTAIDTELSGTHGAGVWTGAQAGDAMALTPAERTAVDAVLTAAHGSGSWQGDATLALRMAEVWTSLGLNTAAPASFDAVAGFVRALAASIDIALSTTGTTVTLTRQP
jgi:hypothetical protein